MTFTYLGDGSTNLDQIRFHIGDTVSGSGKKPAGGNFTNEEIGWLLTDEGTVGKTVARLFETLAAEWSVYADTKVGSRDEKLSKIADHYFSLAKQWRAEHGGGSGTTITVAAFDEDISANDPGTS